MLFTRLIHSTPRGIDVSEYSDFHVALEDVIGGQNRDFSNMTLMELDTDSIAIGRTYDGTLLQEIYDGTVPIDVPGDSTV